MLFRSSGNRRSARSKGTHSTSRSPLTMNFRCGRIRPVGKRWHWKPTLPNAGWPNPGPRAVAIIGVHGRGHRLNPWVQPRAEILDSLVLSVGLGRVAARARQGRVSELALTAKQTRWQARGHRSAEPRQSRVRALRVREAGHDTRRMSVACGRRSKRSRRIDLRRPAICADP